MTVIAVTCSPRSESWERIKTLQAIMETCKASIANIGANPGRPEDLWRTSWGSSRMSNLSASFRSRAGVLH
jgi:hypothetical protein